MVKLIAVERKGDVLTRPALPCLARFHTLNLTAGCVASCRYCYARTFPSYPGDGVVRFYTNTLNLLRRQLPRKRVLPKLVYCSTASEPFAPFPAVLATAHNAFSFLLECGVSLLISTKAAIPEAFLTLFARHPDKVTVQMGLTSVDDGLREALEPAAASVQLRLQSVRALLGRGIHTEVRCDPLTPGLTDATPALADLCQAIASVGVSSLVASYLFFRPGNAPLLQSEPEYGEGGKAGAASLERAFASHGAHLYSCTIPAYCGKGDIIVPSKAYRQKKYAELRALAAARGLGLRLCRCKNPDVTTQCCHPLPAEEPAMVQGALL